MSINKTIGNIFANLKAGIVSLGNYFEIEPDGTWVNKGDSTTWDDIVGSLIGRTLYSNAGTIDYDWDENTLVMQPSGGIDDQRDRAVFNYQYPHSAKTNGTMNLHIHWEQENSTIRVFTIQYRIQKNGQSKTTAWTTATANTTDNNAFDYVSGTLNQITRLVDIDMTDAGISATVEFRLARTDSNSGNINATFIDAHVESDMNGSREEFVK